MAEVAFVCIVVIVAFVLAMRRAPLWAWALAAAIAALAWQSGVLEGDVSRPGTGWALLAWIPAIVLGLLSVPSLRRTWVVARDKLQSVHVAEGPLSRGLGLVHVIVRVAGTTVSLPEVAFADGLAIHEELSGV